MKKLVGVYETTKKDGSVYYRSSVTYKGRHISLGSHENAQSAHLAYRLALSVLEPGSPITIEALSQLYRTESASLEKSKKNIAKFDSLPFEKAVCLLNFRDNGIYFSSPIYLKKSFFYYYLTPEITLLFDKEDLFFYSSHRIMKRGGHLFVAEYGMQTSVLSRYGIRSYAVKDRDYRFLNGDANDLRYSNIEIINRYFGVFRSGTLGSYTYQVKIHINGDLQVGTYKDEKTAAIVYNKAADFCHQYGIVKNFPVNYIEELSAREYADIYSSITLPARFIQYFTSGYNPQS